jgi:metal-sulfur cluster biosynthetic enzyme
MSTTHPRSGAAAQAAAPGVDPAVINDPSTTNASFYDMAAGLRGRVLAALDTVRDPELDRPITDLKFVGALEIEGAVVRVRLRLPTYFCAPNFAYLMVVDALDAVEAVPGVLRCEVVLDDHFASEEINAGAARRSGFRGAFPGEATDELEDLRRTFQRKAHLACLERACRGLIEAGWQLDGLATARLGDLPASPEATSLLRRRADLALPTSADAPLMVDEDGMVVASDQIAKRLRFAKAVRVSIDANAQYCGGLLATRYPD